MSFNNRASTRGDANQKVFTYELNSNEGEISRALLSNVRLYCVPVSSWNLTVYCLTCLQGHVFRRNFGVDVKEASEMKARTGLFLEKY